MLNGYDLSRQWFDFAFENSRQVRPIHTAIYFWCLEKANRLGWVDEFQLPTDESCRALGIKDPKSFRYALTDLVTWGAIRMVQEAASQNVARYISLSGCSLSSKGCLDRVINNENRSSEKRIGDTPSSTLSDTPSGTPTSPLNIKPQTTNHKPQTSARKASPVLAVKIQYRDHVLLTETEYNGLVTKHGDIVTNLILDKLSAFKLSNNKKYASDYGAINTWVIHAVMEDQRRTQGNKPTAHQAPRPAPVEDNILFGEKASPELIAQRKQEYARRQVEPTF